MTTRREYLKTVGVGAALTTLSDEALALGGQQGHHQLANQDVEGEMTVSSTKPFEYVIGIVGSPAFLEIEWSDEQLAKICDLGVNMLQLSIAWGNKPADEVLNLEDLDETQRAKFQHRIAQAKKFGFRTIAHFGIPRMLNYSPVQPACILDPAIRRKYSDLLTDFLTTFPDVRDIMVYTYDQRAWICSEFGPCPRCSGLPLHERLPGFLDHLQATMQQHRPGSTLWWKPWELTKGQTQMIIQGVNPEHFGLMLNPSTSNEVYPFNERSFKSDLGVKRMVQMAVDRGMPVIGEFDYTLYKGLYLISDYFPRLVYEQLQGWREMNGVIGVKEYFGFAPSQLSVNADMLRACLKSPGAPLDELLQEVAAPYGGQAAPLLMQAWEYVAQGVEAFPWDTTYMIGSMGLAKSNDGSHDWNPISISNGHWDTPIWECNRRSNFMLTHEHKAHPWLFEDAGLRLEDAAELHYHAVRLFDEAIAAGGPKGDDIRMQRDAILKTAKAMRGTGLYFLETIAAHDARMVQHDENQWRVVVKRLEALLEKDSANQENAEPIASELASFRNDPKAWLEKHLNPRTWEIICTMDWSKWVPST